jgi:hypothetical protein
VNSAALTRYTGTDAKDNEVWLEVSTATTTTAPVVNLNSYTSSDGSTGLSGGSVTFPAAATNVDTLIPLPLHETERGARSVEAGLNVGTAASAGVVSVLIVRRLATVPIYLAGLASPPAIEMNFLDDVLSLPRIYDNACLGLAYQTGSPNVPTMSGTITVAYG